MNRSRCLGLVGGLGVGAAIHYYRELAKAHEEQGRGFDFVSVHAETSRVFEYVQAGDREGLARYLIGFIRRLKAGGAEVVAIPAITPHLCIRELVAASPLPIFNIFDPLCEELAVRSIHKVAVFGTRYAVKSALFGFVEGVEISQPRPDELDTIHEIYAELLQHGEGSEEQRTELTALANTLIPRDGVEAIILAGTDLSLLFNETNTDFPHFDCAALHLKAILKGLSEESALSPGRVTKD